MNMWSWLQQHVQVDLGNVAVAGVTLVVVAVSLAISRRSSRENATISDRALQESFRQHQADRVDRLSKDFVLDVARLITLGAKIADDRWTEWSVADRVTPLGVGNGNLMEFAGLAEGLELRLDPDIPKEDALRDSVHTFLWAATGADRSEFDRARRDLTHKTRQFLSQFTMNKSPQKESA
jgi:hypothetical protein